MGQSVSRSKEWAEKKSSDRRDWPGDAPLPQRWRLLWVDTHRGETIGARYEGSAAQRRSLAAGLTELRSRSENHTATRAASWRYRSFRPGKTNRCLSFRRGALCSPYAQIGVLSAEARRNRAVRRDRFRETNTTAIANRIGVVACRVRPKLSRRSRNGVPDPQYPEHALEDLSAVDPRRKDLFSEQLA